MLIVIFALLLPSLIAINTTFTVAVANPVINAATQYVWNVTFNSTAPRNTVTLTFPTAVTVQSTSAVSYNGSPLTISGFTPNSITFSGTTLNLTTFVLLTISPILNPPSAIPSTHSFTLTTPLQSLLLPEYHSLSYTPTSLSACFWNFSLCTEQPAGILSITAITSSSIAKGSNRLVVGYNAVWANHQSKSLMFQVSNFNCMVSLDGGGTFASYGCANSEANNAITVSFATNATISGGSTLIIKIVGVQTPPTAETPANPAYYLSTADISSYWIDTLQCTLNPVCLTTLTNGYLSSATPTVNQILTDMQVSFPSYPIITVLPNDIIQLFYSPISNLDNCTVLKFWRNILTLKTLTPLTSNSTSLTFSFPSDPFQLTDSNYSLNLYLACTQILMPQSTAISQMTFYFKRAGSYYMKLVAGVVAVPAGLDVSSFTLVLTDGVIGKGGVEYGFGFRNGQGLGVEAGIMVGFNSSIGITGVGCTLVVNNLTVPVTCAASGSALYINLTASSAIPAGSYFTLTVSNVTNALYPSIHYFSLTTLFNSSQPNSQVQYASQAFNTTFLPVSFTNLTMMPASHAVYSSTVVAIYMNTSVPLPANSTFTLTFPQQITALSAALVQPVSINSSPISVTNLTTSALNNSVSFQVGSAINSGSQIAITLGMTAPGQMGSYSFVTYTVEKSGLLYINSTEELVFVVDTPAEMLISLTPKDQTVSAVCDYILNITYTVPHPSTFSVVVDLPTDTTFIPSASACTPDCLITGTNPSATQLTLLISNHPNSSLLVTSSLTLTSLRNRRFVGSLTANITTKTAANSVISVTGCLVKVKYPNLMSAWSDPSMPYYRNNSDKIYWFVNLTTQLLQSGDYLLATIDRSTYDGSTINCLAILATCAISASSTSKLLVAKIQPNLTAYTGNPLTLELEGLTSGAYTSYYQTDYISLSLFSADGLMETGKIAYKLSCGLYPQNQCKNCHTNGTCTDCYTADGYYLSDGACVTQCGDTSSYLKYANATSMQCLSCIAPCLSCLNSSACLTCAGSGLFLMTDTLQCLANCPTTLGYLVTSSNSSGTSVCTPCADPFCDVCLTVHYGSCTDCSNISTLVNGICLSSCPNPSHYLFNSVCTPCDPSCYTCSGPTSFDCLRCNYNYINYSNICTNTCPNGTALILTSATCGCHSSCLTCLSSNYLYCLTCTNTSLFVYLGQCIGQCPSGYYQIGNECLGCAAGCGSCNSAVCFSCLTNWYLFNFSCYSDCNLIGERYHLVGGGCLLCPQGCDSCGADGVCSSCLGGYALSGGQCRVECGAEGCLEQSGRVVGLPGCMALTVWVLVLVLVKYKMEESGMYVPYAVVFLSAVIQFALLLSVTILIMSSSTPTSTLTRLLLTSSTLTSLQALFLLCLALNYIFNILHLILFFRYLKPLMKHPLSSSSALAMVAVLTISTLTNFKMGVLLFSRLCTTPQLQITNSSKLTPLHYLCIASGIFDIFTIIACGISIYTETVLSPLFMLSIDLLVIVVVNILLTVWMVIDKKTDGYYTGGTPKYQTEYSHTQQNVNNDKDASKINIVIVDQKTTEDNNQHVYVVARRKQGQNREKDEVNSDDEDSKYDGREENRYYGRNQQLQYRQGYNYRVGDKQLAINEYIIDDDMFQTSLPPKLSSIGHSHSNSHTNPTKRYPSRRNQHKLDKQLYQPEALPENIFEVDYQQENQEEEQMPGLNDSDIDSVSVRRQRRRQYQIQGTDKDKQSNERYHSEVIEVKKVDGSERESQMQQNGSGLPQGLTKKVGFKPQVDDFQTIVMRKVLKSTVLKQTHQKQISQMVPNTETEVQDLSPSLYNAANQRFSLDEPQY